VARITSGSDDHHSPVHLSTSKSTTNKGAANEFSRSQSSEREGYVIKKVKGGYKVVSSKGKNLEGPYKTVEEAKKRPRQVEFFKHRNGP
jgi:hypothetical protein